MMVYEEFNYEKAAGKVACAMKDSGSILVKHHDLCTYEKAATYL